MSRYEPISEFLNSQSTKEVIIDFKKIEQIISRKLPQSAFQYNAWWANNPSHHSHARAWANIGWKTQDVDIANQKVKFVKENTEPKLQDNSAQQIKAKPKKSIFGALKGTVKINDDNFFAPLGIKWNAQEGKF
jgi:hypothetical protein